MIIIIDIVVIAIVFLMFVDVVNNDFVTIKVNGIFFIIFVVIVTIMVKDNLFVVVVITT